MKNEIRLALLCLATASAPAFAQSGSPMCGSTNFDSAQNAFTIVNPAAGAVNQQCFVTVYPSGAMPAQAQQDPKSYIAEGKYVVDLVGGGGGGGGGGAGAKNTSGEGGGGGAGAAPSRTVQYLSPGVYKLTIGTGGYGGAAQGGRTGDGNPSSLTNAHTGQLVAGFAGADVWTQKSEAAGTAAGGVAAPGGTSGASGQPNTTAGGSGGASVGSGGTDTPARANELADAGGQGGNGLIRLTMSEPAPQAMAAAPVVVARAPMMQRYSLSTDTLFGFGKSTLRPAGEAKLDDLLSKLREVNVDSITDTGHADRIGSSELNQRLSVSRAESVKAYLVSRGIESSRISVAGMGESQPVTSAADCKGPASAKVIACLQPDRRVDIDVLGTNKMVGMN